MKNKKIDFLWRVTASHTIAYFIAGCFAMYVFNYKDDRGLFYEDV